MNIQRFANDEELSRELALAIAGVVRKKPDARLCLAAGHTSLGTFKAMIGLAEQNEVSFDRCVFVGLDEWGGLGKEDDGSCSGFMHRCLFEPLGIRDEQIVFYDGRADLELECQRMDSYLRRHGPIDFMLLGMGMNGHLGLNEPGTPFHLYSHVVELDETTKTVGQKYFSKETALSRGITMGMQHIKESKTVVLAVTGAQKAEIVKKLIDSQPDEAMPASFLKTLDHASLFIDAEAARLIK